MEFRRVLFRSWTLGSSPRVTIELVAIEVHSVATSQTVIPDKRAQLARSGIHGWAERASQYLGCRPGTCCRDPWIVSIEQSRKSADKSFGAYANGSRGQAPGRLRCMKPLCPLPFRQRIQPFFSLPDAGDPVVGVRREVVQAAGFRD